MPRPLPLMLGALLSAAPAAAWSADDQVRAGYWETATEMSVAGKSFKDTRRRCVRPQELESLLGSANSKDVQCAYATREVAGGKIRLVGSCKAGKTAFPVESTGDYTPDTVRMESRIRGKYGLIHFTMRVVSNSRRLGETCPAAAS